MLKNLSRKNGVIGLILLTLFGFLSPLSIPFLGCPPTFPFAPDFGFPFGFVYSCVGSDVAILAIDPFAFLADFLIFYGISRGIRWTYARTRNGSGSEPA